MHIGIVMNQVIPPKKYGGANRIVGRLCSELISVGMKVSIYAAPGSDIPGASTYVIPHDFENQVASDWIDSTVDIVHMHCPHHVITHKPLLVTQQGNGLSRVFPHMSFVSRSHAANHGSDCYVHNGLDVSDYPAKNKGDYLVFLADASWGVKNLRTAVSLAEDTKTKLLVMGGQGNDSKYVTYLGMIGESEGKLDILSKAKALVYLANWDEPCAVAVLEAMACGTPVIATKNGCFPELISPDTGFCVDSYAEAISAVQSIGQINPADCRRRVHNQFSQGIMTEKYVDLYKSILNESWSYKIPSYDFKSRLRKVYKPTMRNILHFEFKHRKALYCDSIHDYSYRTRAGNDFIKLNF